MALNGRQLSRYALSRTSSFTANSAGGSGFGLHRADSNPGCGHSTHSRGRRCHRHRPDWDGEARGQSLLLMICDESRLHLGLKTDEKGIMRGNGPTIVWFKDPAGNIFPCSSRANYWPSAFTGGDSLYACFGS